MANCEHMISGTCTVPLDENPCASCPSRYALSSNTTLPYMILCDGCGMPIPIVGHIGVISNQ